MALDRDVTLFFWGGKEMDIEKELARLKSFPGFKEEVGMILIHNGIVRGRSRKNGRMVEKLKVVPDYDKIEEIRNRYERRRGIFKIVVKAREGIFSPGDDLLWIIVAGDIRENVKDTLSSLLDEIKSKAITKQEYIQQSQ